MDSSFFFVLLSMTNNKTVLIMMLLRIHGIGGQTVQKIMKQVKDIDKAVEKWDLLVEFDLPRLKQAITGGILSKNIWQRVHQEVLVEIKRADDLNVMIVSYQDVRYPKRLLKLRKFPAILYVKGDCKLLNAEKLVTIVGTRNPTELGIKRNIEMTTWFTLQGYVIVSGLAQGCDFYAHQTAARTIAVLAHGLDQPIYPQTNTQLSEDILAKGGVLVSTYPLGTKIIPQHLAARDEWQSGLGDGVIVVEVGLTGGTHTTINFALKQMKPLAVLRFGNYCQTNLGNEEYLTDPRVDGLTMSDTFLNFVKRMNR